MLARGSKMCFRPPPIFFFDVDQNSAHARVQYDFNTAGLIGLLPDLRLNSRATPLSTAHYMHGSVNIVAVVGR